LSKRKEQLEKELSKKNPPWGGGTDETMRQNDETKSKVDNVMANGRRRTTHHCGEIDFKNRNGNNLTTISAQIHPQIKTMRRFCAKSDF